MSEFFKSGLKRYQDYNQNRLDNSEVGEFVYVD